MSCTWNPKYKGKLKLDAIKHQGKKSDMPDDELLLVSSDIIGTESNKSGRQIRRYIRLTELIYPLLDKVDIKIIPVTAGAEVSFLNVKLQVSLNGKLQQALSGVLAASLFLWVKIEKMPLLAKNVEV